jgi:hypothetical protein
VASTKLEFIRRTHITDLQALQLEGSQAVDEYQ